MSRYTDKICVVTGGTKGIGLACAQLFAREGGTTVICSSKQANVDQALKAFDKNAKVDSIVCDMAKKDDRLKMVEHISQKYGRIDVLFLNAAVITHVGKQLQITEEQFD